MDMVPTVGLCRGTRRQAAETAAKMHRQRWQYQSCEKKNKLHEAIRNACYDTNKSLTESSIDVYVSGTTCISGIISGKTLYTINIGDSRAVMGRMVNGKLRSVDLSVDQKPDRPVSTQCRPNPCTETSNRYCVLFT